MREERREGLVGVTGEVGKREEGQWKERRGDRVGGKLSIGNYYGSGMTLA